MAEFDLLASAAFGLEALVVRELTDLGYPNARVDDGRVRFRGDLAAICRTNLWLRCAERVQVVIADFPARDFDDLFDRIKVLPWEDWLPADAKFPVTARCVRSEIRSVPNTQKMVKRAIVERLRKVYSRHWFAETGVEYPIDAHVLGDRVLLTIDTTGDGLHKRGYRNLVGRAPLRETLAAAMVKLSYWHRDRLLVDPFCGSGTIPIEAALIGRNLAPGRNRSFTAENWGQIPRAVWTAARQEVKELEIRQPLGIPILGTDRDRYAIKMATQHARQAGVETEIHFEAKDFVAFPTHRDAGVLICNPPYGERLGEEEEVRQLYRDMGELLRPLEDWSLYILTGAEGFEREFGKKADRRRKLYNARIACTYYQYLGPKPAGRESREDLPESPEQSTPLPADSTGNVTGNTRETSVWKARSTSECVDESNIENEASSSSSPPPAPAPVSPTAESDNIRDPRKAISPSEAGEISSTSVESSSPPSPPNRPRPNNPWANARRPHASESSPESSASSPQQSHHSPPDNGPHPLKTASPSANTNPVDPGHHEEPVPPVSSPAPNPWKQARVAKPVLECPASTESVSEQKPVSGSLRDIARQSFATHPSDGNNPLAMPSPSPAPSEIPKEESALKDSSGSPLPETALPSENDSKTPPAPKDVSRSHPWKKNPWPRS